MTEALPLAVTQVQQREHSSNLSMSKMRRDFQKRIPFRSRRTDNRIQMSRM